MLTANELTGVSEVMPTMAAPDAVDIQATQTIAVDCLKEGMDKFIKNGVNNIAALYKTWHGIVWLFYRLFPDIRRPDPSDEPFLGLHHVPVIAAHRLEQWDENFSLREASDFLCLSILTRKKHRFFRRHD